MSGLLDKAKAAKESEEAPKEPESILATEPAAKSSGSTAMISNGSQSLFAQFSKPGMALGGLAFLLTWFLGSYTL
ncbi:MAG: hypothetical protein L7S48_07615, partial [Candidatus Poseidonia sp.]|nr:hypothetical protein [Poseidonia sp.]